MKALKQQSKKTFIPNFGFPKQLVQPIAQFLSEQAKKLELRKKSISRDDPFEKIERGWDKAAPDTEVAERFGHESLVAVKDQLDRRLVQSRKALTRIKLGKYGMCEACGRMIDTDRLMIYPEATLCVECEKKREGKKKS